LGVNRIGREGFEAIRKLIREKLVEEGVPSLAVAVASNGQIVWEEGFGWANREDRVPATEHTMYSIASIAKPMTATGLMVLQERGKLGLDRPVNDYLGEARLRGWVGDAEEATVRRVANHTSGLPPHYHFFYEDEPFRPPPMDETIRRYGHLVAAPGERYQYSNLGYGILGYVIARLSETGYADFMRQEVFLPLGMTRASVGIGPGLERYTAARYDSEGRPIPFYDFDHPGGSAVFCSVHDLARFALFHLGCPLPDQKRILNDASVREMQRSTARSGETGGYGIGWMIREDPHGCHSVGHIGLMTGVTAHLRMIPAEQLVVAVVANAFTSLPEFIIEQVLSTLLPASPERRAQAEQPAADAERPSAEFRPTTELLGEWQGSIRTYCGKLPFTLGFRESGDVHARLDTQLTTLLNDVRYEAGRLTGRMMGDIGTEDANRRPYHLHLDLLWRGEVLNGAVTAISVSEKRMGHALSHFAELRKV
jgi:CubicO group peptidase (beta-lactamase class C family)